MYRHQKATHIWTKCIMQCVSSICAWPSGSAARTPSCPPCDESARGTADRLGMAQRWTQSLRSLGRSGSRSLSGGCAVGLTVTTYTRRQNRAEALQRSGGEAEAALTVLENVGVAGLYRPHGMGGSACALGPVGSTLATTDNTARRRCGAFTQSSQQHN
jgi:hypothetical protein